MLMNFTSLSVVMLVMAPKQPNSGLFVGLKKGHVVTLKELATRPSNRKGTPSQTPMQTPLPGTAHTPLPRMAQTPLPGSNNIAIGGTPITASEYPSTNEDGGIPSTRAEPGRPRQYMEMEVMLPTGEANIMEQELVISLPPKLRRPHPDPYPWLIICDGKSNERQAFYSILEDQYHVCAVPELQNKSICCCNQEWLVLIDNSTYMSSVLNILTMEKVQLPPFDLIDWGSDRCVLSLNSDGSSWRVLFFAGPDLKLLSYHLGDSEFLEQKPIITEYSDYVKCATSFGGELYVVTLDYDLFSADLSNRSLDFTQVVDGCPLGEIVIDGSSTKSYLVESCGQLIFVIMTFIDNGVMDISIFRADFDRGEWVRLNDLGDGAIFLDEASTSGFSYPDAMALGLKANSIYYVFIRRRNLFVYDIQDQSITMCLPCPVVDFRSSLAWMFIPNKNQ